MPPSARARADVRTRKLLGSCRSDALDVAAQQSSPSKQSLAHIISTKIDGMHNPAYPNVQFHTTITRESCRHDAITAQALLSAQQGFVALDDPAIKRELLAGQHIELVRRGADRFRSRLGQELDDAAIAHRAA